MTAPVRPLGAVAARAWADLGGSTADLDLVGTTPAPLPSRLPVGSLAVDAMGVASLAAQLCAADRSGRPARPALPVQALDHASGHLLAAGVVSALRERARTGGSHAVSVALARTALALQQLAPEAPSTGVPDDLPTVGTGRIRCAAPVLAHDGAPRDYARLGTPSGIDPARWW